MNGKSSEKVWRNPRIFIVGVGRSGTDSFASALGLEHELGGKQVTFEQLKKLLDGYRTIRGTSSQYLIPFLPELIETYPNDLFIHIVRNPRNVVKSWQLRKGWFENSTRVEEGYRMFMGLDSIIDGFTKLNRFEQLCTFWVYWNNYIDDILPIRIRIEDVEHILPDMNKSTYDMREWTEEEEQSLERICGDLMNKYNYKL